jgi:hypothetical protein
MERQGSVRGELLGWLVFAFYLVVVFRLRQVIDRGASDAGGKQ